MGIRRLLIGLGLLACLTFTVLAVAGCGGDPTGSGLDSGTQAILEERITAIRDQPVPDSVDPLVFEQLTTELVKVISAEAGRQTATPPTGDLNAVNDLVLAGDDIAGWYLQWSYLNVGDYDLNGMVSVSDLTPVGQYFNVAAGEMAWDDARRADGDGNGVVSVSDITPIGQNFEAFISGFNIYGSDSAAGAWELVDSIPRPELPEDGPYLITCELAERGYECYQVVPFDSSAVEGSAGCPSANQPEPVTATVGVDTILISQTIGAAGGTVSAPAGSAIEGVTVSFPAGALAEDTLVELGWNDGTVAFPGGTAELPILTIEAGDVYEFAEPCQITVPFTGGEDTIPFACYLRDDGSLEGMQAVDVDYEADLFTFETFHTTRFRIEYIGKKGGITNPAVGLWMGFHYEEDDFWAKNTSTKYTAGNCLGMAAFAQWYYREIGCHGLELLYDSYRNIVQADPLVFNQQVIATRAQLSVHRYYMDYIPAILGRGYVATPAYNFNAVVNMFEITGEPQVVVLDSGSSRHAVLAYGTMIYTSNPDNVILWIYDPNIPGTKRKLEYVPSSQTFKPYTSGSTTYNKVIHFGTGTIKYGESFGDILADANNNFAGSADATIEVQTPANGATVTTQLVDITGTVSSGEALVEYMSIMNGTYTVEAVLSPTGEFDVQVPLHEGMNYLSFLTKGYNLDNRLVIIHNNLLNTGFLLEADFPPAEITITSHTNGETVTDRNILLAGTITGGVGQVGRLTVTVAGEDEYTCSVAGDGSFSLPISLRDGANPLVFLTEVQSGESWEEVENSLGAGGFTLTGDFYITNISIETTWETSTDLLVLNAWIILPDGEYFGGGHTSDGWWEWHNYNQRKYSCYVSSERWGTIQWGGSYKLRLQVDHYNIVDPPGENFPYTVRLRINEGLASEENYVYTGIAPFEEFHHPTVDADYWDPFTVRNGWIDVCSFVPVAP